MQQHGLTDLFVETLKDIYSAEKQILRSLPKLARAADSETLREAFLTHRDQTEDQIERLDQVFEMLRERPGRETCEAMQGILEEGEEAIAEYTGSDALDAGLISSAQAVEHYEINRYTALRDWAEVLELDDAVSLLAESLNEERETDRLLTQIAEGEVNEEAEGGASSVPNGNAAKSGAQGKTGTGALSAGGSATAAKTTPSKRGATAAAASPAATAQGAAKAQPGSASATAAATSAASRPASGSGQSPGGGAGQSSGGAATSRSGSDQASAGGPASGAAQKSSGGSIGRTAGDDDKPASGRPGSSSR